MGNTRECQAIFPLFFVRFDSVNEDKKFLPFSELFWL